jgi:uncharacterized membrane protein
MVLAVGGGGWESYLGVFLASATPLLEVLVVVPAGVLAGLSPLPTVLVAIAGNLSTVALVALAGDKFRWWWRRRRPKEDREPSRRSQRGRQLVERWGVPGMALLAPLTTGTHVGALAALATGTDRGRVLRWMAVGVSVWAAAAALATVAGLGAFT